MTDAQDEVGKPETPVRGPDPDDAGDFQYDEAHLAANGGPGAPGEGPDRPDRPTPEDTR
jgi:hypothetical protein